ncbi:MAG: gliding motility-associated ABC transporter substrate-binding protein GldG [Bacteroidales bacterium]|jgi:ABC-2 type transport system permease protein|nr:gliding motility-associated ABC transporter substrate-binding protein GldG [Bacteroidales bacterium]
MKQGRFLRSIGIIIVAIVAINALSSVLYERFDLTQDNRYTLSPTSKEILRNLNDTIRFSVYLQGDLPVAYSRMRREISDMLHEFQRLGASRIEILFLDPVAQAKNDKERQEIYRRMVENYGLMPTPISRENSEGKIEQQLIFPSMIVSTPQRFVPVNLLASATGATLEEQIHVAMQQFEYQVIKSIKQLTATERKTVAFITNHGEYPLQYVYDFTMSLRESYNVERITTRQLWDSIDKYTAVVCAQPITAFSDSSKFILDQYVMQGGSVLFAADNIDLNADTLQRVANVEVTARDLNVSEVLFNWGARINPAILIDRQSATIPLNVNPPGMAARYEAVPWWYYPLLRPTQAGHSITNNIDVVKAEFASNVDTVEGNGYIRKTVLLESSSRARLIGLPNTIGFGILNISPTDEFFNRYNVPVAVLLEGQITSLYANRQAPFALQQRTLRKSADSLKIIVMGDANILKNEVNPTSGQPMPLYYYKYAAIDKRQYFGNKEFLLNAMDYLCGEYDLLTIRSREFKIRLLNKNRIKSELVYWKLFNILLPILLVIAGGVVVYVARTRKFAKKYVG